MASVEFGLDERGHLDAADLQTLELAIDVRPDQVHAPHPCAREVDLTERRPAQVDHREPSAVQVGDRELGARDVTAR
jgi:hypothetical protein